MRAFPLILTVLLSGLAPIAAQADSPPTAKAPATVMQQYASGAQSFAVSVKLYNDIDKDNDTAYLAFTRPNQLKIVSRLEDSVVATVVSDGVTLWQWNKKYYRKRSAPASLDQINPTIPMGLAAKLAHSLFVSQQPLENTKKWRDVGPAKIDGISARKVVSGGTTAWLAVSTGLPLKMLVHNDTADYSATFSYPSLNSSLPDDTFAAAPPPDVVPMPMPFLHTPDTDEAGLLPDGTLAPDFTLMGLDGKKVTLSSLRGQVVVLDFWASWCPPCRETMPHIQKIHEELGGKGMTVLSVNTWDDWYAMKAFLKNNPQYTTKMLSDGSQETAVSTTKYLVKGIPTVYLIDTEGRIAASYVGAYPDEETMLKDALAKLGVN